MFWLLLILSACIGIILSVPTFWYIEKRLWAATLKEYDIECPIDYEWKFTKADLILAIRNSADGHLQGRCFYHCNIPGLHCRLIIYPNGININHRGQTWLFLFVNASMERKIAAQFKFSIESANYVSESINYVFEKYELSGANLCKTTKFFDWKNKYFVDEEITIKVKGMLKAKRPLIPPSATTIARPISFQWKIKENDLKEAMGPDSRNTLHSTVYNTTASIRDLRYFFGICLNKFDVHENKVGASVYLGVNIGDEMETKAVFDFSIDSAFFCSSYEYVYKKAGGYGGFVCSPEDLFDPSKRYIVDGYLTINFTGIFMVERNPRMTMKCKNASVSRLASQNPKDFFILVGDQQIQVHKQLLMDVSPVWAGMFGSEI